MNKLPLGIWLFMFLSFIGVHELAHANSKFVAPYDVYGNFSKLEAMEKAIREVAERNNLEVKVARSPGLPPDPKNSRPSDYAYPLFLIRESFLSPPSHPLIKQVTLGIGTQSGDITIMGASAPRALLVQFVKVLEERFDLVFETEFPPQEESLNPVCGKNRTFVASFDAYENFPMIKEIEGTIRMVAGRNALKVKVLQSHGMPPNPEDGNQGLYRYPRFFIAEDFDDWASKKRTGFCVRVAVDNISIFDKPFTSLTLLDQFMAELKDQFDIVFDVAPYDEEENRRCLQRCMRE